MIRRGRAAQSRRRRREIGRLHEALLAHSPAGYRPAAELLTALHG